MATKVLAPATDADATWIRSRLRIMTRGASSTARCASLSASCATSEPYGRRSMRAPWQSAEKRRNAAVAPPRLKSPAACLRSRVHSSSSAPIEEQRIGPAAALPIAEKNSSPARARKASPEPMCPILQCRHQRFRKLQPGDFGISREAGHGCTVFGCRPGGLPTRYNCGNRTHA